MSLDEVRRPAWQAGKAWLLHIGTASVRSVVWHGRGARGTWTQAATVALPTEEGATPTDKLRALVRALEQLPSWQGDDRPQALHVTVADAWLAGACLPWSARLERQASASAYVREQLSASGFLVAEDDIIRMDGALYGATRQVVCYPAALVNALDAFASTHGMAMASLLPLSVAARQAVSGTKAEAVSIIDDGQLIVMRMRQGLGRLIAPVEDLAVRRVERHREAHAAHTQWRRMRLRDGAWAGLTRGVLIDVRTPGAGDQTDGQAVSAALQPFDVADDAVTSDTGAALDKVFKLPPSHRKSHPLDGVPQDRACRRSQTMLAAVLACMALFMLWEAVADVIDVKRLDSQLAKAGNKPVLEHGEHTPRWSKDELPRVRAVNVAVRALNAPMGRLLEALQPPADIHVTLLSVESGAASASEVAVMRITAEAQASADMVRYVAFVGARKPFTQAYLSRHEVDRAAAEQPYRFTLEATWRDE